MIKLDYIEKENKGVAVKVYDGDVTYQNSDKWNNFCYYFDERGKRVKTRPYAQWTAMYGRCSEGGSYKKRFDASIQLMTNEGFKVVEEPRISLSHAVVLQKK